jgi:predicted RNA-binding protein associated with RNAse of E/G family
METLKLFRKRIIPTECIHLKDDVILKETDDIILTKWTTLKPKCNFTHGRSCYFLKKGIKVSQFLQADESLLYFYCDIVDFSREDDSRSLIVTDLLVDVIIYPDGRYKVVDLDELADAMEAHFITDDQMQLALRRLNYLLTMIYKDKFDNFTSEFNNV